MEDESTNSSSPYGFSQSRPTAPGNHDTSDSSTLRSLQESQQAAVHHHQATRPCEAAAKASTHRGCTRSPSRLLTCKQICHVKLLPIKSYAISNESNSRKGAFGNVYVATHRNEVERNVLSRTCMQEKHLNHLANLGISGFIPPNQRLISSSLVGSLTTPWDFPGHKVQAPVLQSSPGSGSITNPPTPAKLTFSKV